MGNIVYHYCSISTFLNIIQSKCLRFYDIDKSKRCSDRKNMYTSYHNRFQSAVDQILQMGNADSPVKYEDRQLIPRNHDIHEEHKAYVACFSMEGDLKRGWQRYADEGHGLSIGFDSDVLSSCSKIFKDLFHYKNIEYIPSSYDLERCLNENENDFEYESLFVKDDSNSEEKEVRAVIYNSMNNKISLNNIIKSMEIHGDNALRFKGLCFDSDSDTISSFIEMNFDRIKSNFIKKIYIGPDCKVEHEDVRLLLDVYEYDIISVEIVKSKL